VKPAGLEKKDDDDTEPWCHLLAANYYPIMGGYAPLPAAKSVKGPSPVLKVLESMLYVVMGLGVIAGLAYWYYIDSTTLKKLKGEVAHQQSLALKAMSRDNPAELAKLKTKLEKELAYLKWLEEEAEWRRQLPSKLIAYLSSVPDWEGTYITDVEGRPEEDSYLITLKGRSKIHGEVQALQTGLQTADFAAGSKVVIDGPRFDENDLDPSFAFYSINIRWPLHKKKSTF
jgi:hypothetical protein